MSVNIGIADGHCGQEPQVFKLDDGKKIARFNIASNERYTDKQGQTQEKTIWLPVAIYNNATAQYVEQNVHKGTHVIVEGRMETTTYDKDGETRHGFELAVRPYNGMLRLLGAKPQTAAAPASDVASAIGPRERQAALPQHNQ